MTLQPPPSITPHQMNLLRIAASMAWADGNLSEEEVDVMLDRFSNIFAAHASQADLRQELRDYVMQNIPISELTPNLQNDAERGLILRLGYEVIASSGRTPEEEKINVEEAAAYQKLVSLLGLPPETVLQIQAEAIDELNQSESVVDSIARKLKAFVQQ